jgi:hypothetical protein
MNISFCCHLCSSSFVIFGVILLNLRWPLSVNDDFRLLFLFANVVFQPFLYTDITLKTLALDTPNNETILSQMLQLNAQQPSVPFRKPDKSPPIFSSFKRLSPNKITNTLQCVNKRKNNIQLPTEVLSMLPTQILFLNFFVFPLFCPLPTCIRWASALISANDHTCLTDPKHNAHHCPLQEMS